MYKELKIKILSVILYTIDFRTVRIRIGGLIIGGGVGTAIGVLSYIYLVSLEL